MLCNILKFAQLIHKISQRFGLKFYQNASKFAAKFMRKIIQKILTQNHPNYIYIGCLKLSRIDPENHQKIAYFGK